MATHDITLPAGTRPVFSPRCVACETENPTAWARISVTGADGGPGIGEVALDAATGQTRPINTNSVTTLEVPACPRCAKALERLHFWKTFWLYVGALGGVAALIAVVATINSVWLGVVALVVGVACPVIWELKYPPAFTITPYNGRVTYEFRSQRCAEEFAERNQPG